VVGHLAGLRKKEKKRAGPHGSHRESGQKDCRPRWGWLCSAPRTKRIKGTSPAVIGSMQERREIWKQEERLREFTQIKRKWALHQELKKRNRKRKVENIKRKEKKLWKERNGSWLGKRKKGNCVWDP
jgi:hypothetical protein